MRLNKIWGLSLNLIAVTIVASAFVNCSKIGFTSYSSTASYKDSQGNGDNYDGKLFVHSDPTHPCADGSSKRGVIQLVGGAYSLVHENCLRLTPARAIPTADITVDGTYSGLISYKSEKYIFDATALASKPADLDCVKRNLGPLDGLKLYNVQGPKGPMVAGILTASGKAYNLVFDSATIATSPATAKMSGQDQENTNGVTLSGWDPSAGHPDGTNTAYTLSQGPLGAEGFVSCQRPGGGL